MAYFKAIVCSSMVLVLAIPNPVLATDIDFGDDSSEWANDGECDDPRFQGSGMTGTTLLDSDIRRDATDCRVAYEQGRLTLKQPNSAPATVQWGDDNGEWANDGECDDMRFEGPGMTETPLLESDVKHDATDCRSAWEAGTIWLRG